MLNRKSKGDKGENLALAYLLEKKYDIIDRNYRKPFGEIDIVAQALGGTLVFVEVKTVVRTDVSRITPEDNLTPHKLRKLQRICQMYANDHPQYVSEEYGWQIDLVAVTLTSDSKSFSINHYENIF